MLAKAIRSKRGSSGIEAQFERRIGYICKGADAKSGAILTRNLAGGWRDAGFQMSATAGLRPRLRSPDYHLVLTWGDGETPANAEVLAAGIEVLRIFGAEEHQCVLAVHRNRPNIHLHALINRVHPLSGVVLSDSHDFARLELACRQVELLFGWPPDRGRFRCSMVGSADAGEVQLLPMPEAHWQRKRESRAAGLRPDPRGVRGLERREGQRPLRDRLPPRLLTALREGIERARSWPQVHVVLLAKGLRYLRHGAGARIEEVSSKAFMPAGQLGSAFGLHHMVARLGAFQPAADGTLSEMAARAAARHKHARRRQERRDALERLRTEHQEARARLRQKIRSLARPLRQAFRRALALDQTVEMQTLRARLPLPILAAHGLGVTEQIGGPGDVHAARFRHVRRAAQMKAVGIAMPPPRRDHTWARQQWRAAQDAAMRDGSDDSPDSADWRLADGSWLLLRRDPDAGVLGFDRLVRGPDGDRIRRISGGELAFVHLGRGRNDQVFLLRDGDAALKVAARFPDALVLIAGGSLSERMRRHLRDLGASHELIHLRDAAKVKALLGSVTDAADPDARCRASPSILERDEPTTSESGPEL
ncbi:hypothetical protein FAZ78_13390 [Cereibacter changlensis]|uniref:MobA/VirD2-like nuclease domain-containing protein n=1 Tax=Cereibacter changlensis TaxID=402884 RepID=A0A4U0Z0X4_9RHOB|nr:relaxase/mobilization nuclease domain-containing protein [Cereibacter changlensis]TKA96084.1 hypothetical protein FAZ78_13390 [Cereibacter changlensis]